MLLLTEDEYNDLSWQAEALSHRKKIPVSEAAAAREFATQAPAQLDELRHALDHIIDCAKTKLCADCRRLLTHVQEKR